MAACLLGDLLQVEIVHSSKLKRASLDEREDMVSIYMGCYCLQPHTHLVSIVPVRGQVKDLGTSRPYPRDRTHTSSRTWPKSTSSFAWPPSFPDKYVCPLPAQECVGGIGNRVGSQPPTRIILIRFGVVF